VKLTVANSKEFGRLLDGLGDDVVDAAIHFRLYKDLRESVRNFERELNQARISTPRLKAFPRV